MMGLTQGPLSRAIFLFDLKNMLVLLKTLLVMLTNMLVVFVAWVLMFLFQQELSQLASFFRCYLCTNGIQVQIWLTQ